MNPSILVALLLVLAGLAVVGRGSWSRIFGPVLFYDMIRVARRGRHFRLRMIYAVALLAALAFAWAMAEAGSASSALQRDARLAEEYFLSSMLVQLVAVGLLTPAYVGAAIGEEKERRTLEFMLATDLSNREIVLGKFVARLAHVVQLILIGLPILSFLQFLGGIDPELVLAGFLATIATAVGTGAFGILCSVLQRRALGGVLAAFTGWIGYNLAGFVLWGLAQSGWSALGYRPDFPGAPSVDELVDLANRGNLLVAVWRVLMAVAASQLYVILWDVVRDYALFHAIGAVVCLSLATWRLRSVSLRQAFDLPPARRGRHVRRPLLGDMPIVWREAYLESGMLSRVFTAILYLAFGGSFLTAVSLSPNWRAPDFRLSVTVLTCGSATVVAFLLILSIGVRASAAISSEREKSTWDALLTTPLDSDTILQQKLLACLLSRWPIFLLLVLMWLCGVILGDMHPLEPIILTTFLLLNTTTIAIAGLWYSLRSASSSAALVSVLVLCLAPLCICNQLSPASIFGYVPMLSHMLRHGQVGIGDEMLLIGLIGAGINLIVYGASASYVWFQMLKPKFRRATLRHERRPRSAPPEELHRRPSAR